MLTIPNGPSITVPVLTHRSGQTYKRYAATSSPLRGRVYYMHGLNGRFDDPVVNDITGRWGDIMATFRSTGWEFIAYADPADVIDKTSSPSPLSNSQYFDIRDDPGNGSRFLATVLASFDNMVKDVTGNYGSLPSVHWGCSYGGWTTCHIAHNRAVMVDGRAMAGMVTCYPAHQLSVCTFPLGGSGSLLWPFTTTGADVPDAALNSVVCPAWVGFNTADTVVYPQGADAMTKAALAAGAPLAKRVITDGVISGGVNFSSATAGLLTPDNGSVITGTGIPGGTTIGSVAGGGSGPWTGTLSQTCTNGSALTCTFPGLAPAYGNDHFLVSQAATDIQTWITNVLNAANPAVF